MTRSTPTTAQRNTNERIERRWIQTIRRLWFSASVGGASCVPEPLDSRPNSDPSWLEGILFRGRLGSGLKRFFSQSLSARLGNSSSHATKRLVNTPLNHIPTSALEYVQLN